MLFSANGKWPNCMSVSATSTGRLVLRNSEAFNEKATLSVGSGLFDVAEHGLILFLR